MDALGDIAGTVVAVYGWKETTRSWLAHLPDLEDIPGLNTLTTFNPGRKYWIAVEEPTTWEVSVSAGAQN